MKKAAVFSLCFVVVMMAFLPAAQACTVLSAADNNSSLFGNNEDWFDKDTLIWFVPGQPGKYGVVCVGFENAHPQGGMNEAGLAFDWVAFNNPSPGNFAPALNNKADVSGDINAMLLETCADVDDVIAFYRTHNDPNLGYASMLVADRSGKSAVISWDRQQNDISISVASSGLNSIGYGAEPAKVLFEENADVSADKFRELLRAAVQPGMTLYSNIFDLKTGDIVLYNIQDFENAVRLSLAAELEKGAHIISIPALFGEENVPGYDVLYPSMLLPLYLQITIYALGAVFLLGTAFMILSLIRCESPNPLKVAVRSLGIATGVMGPVLLYILYQRWYFISAYGLAMLGPLVVILGFAFSSAALAQFALSITAVARRSFKKPAGVIYIILSAIALLTAAELFISGFMIR